MKRTISIAATLLVMLAMLTPVKLQATENVVLRWDETTSVTATYQFASGTFTVTVIGLTGASKVAASVTVYEVNGSSRTVVGSLSGSRDARTGTFIGNASYVKGRSYEMVVTTTVTRNGNSEVTTRTVEEKY